MFGAYELQQAKSTCRSEWSLSEGHGEGLQT